MESLVISARSPLSKWPKDYRGLRFRLPFPFPEPDVLSIRIAV
jgi:hypothetical protein